MYRRLDNSSGSRPDYSNVAPPPDINKKQAYVDVSQIPSQTSSYNSYRKKAPKLDDEYFDDDEEDNGPRPSTTTNDEGDDEEEDPLDAFMAGLENEVKKPPKASIAQTKPLPMSAKKDAKVLKGVRQDIEDADAEESFYKYMEENPHAGMNTVMGDSEDEEEEGGRQIEYDADGNPIGFKGPDVIDPLAKIDHSTIEYKPFNKNFYHEHEDIASLTAVQVAELRQKLNIKLLGPSPPKPVTSFAHFGFDEQLLKVIRKSEYSQPTPIQSQAVPIALSGRDIIGIAKTGSGKTAAFIWPMLVHIMDQSDLKAGDGPIGLILAPTRELSQQIYTEARKFGKTYNINIVCAYGGGSKWEQSKDLEAGAEIVVATPGRLIDLVKMKATNLTRVTCMVLDEADKMFNMGFEPQVRSICDHVRPDRQTMLFSATFKKRIEKLARDVLTDPIKIVQGDTGEANADITQHVLVFQEGAQKWDWLMSHLVEFMSAGSVLIFVTKKLNADELASNLKVLEHDCLLIHGDMGQAARNEVIWSFKKKEKPILVATDVAARGLDISHIRTVVNYDVARDIDTHTHRIGRTGRAGEKGDAYTLVTEKDKEFAGHLVRNLEGANQIVPNELMELALQSSWFHNSRFKTGHAKKINVGGVGLGFKARPGFGAGSSSKPTTGTSIPYSEMMVARAAGGSSSLSVNNKVASLRAAFATQYKSQFKAATDTAWREEAKLGPPPPANDEAPKKKSRWDK